MIKPRGKKQDQKLLTFGYIMDMQNLLLFENFSREKITTLTSRQGRNIKVTTIGGRIKDIVNEAGIRFPFSPGQTLTRNLETWACNNGFKIDGEDPCPEEKIFGVKVSDVPQGHEWRYLYPSKFQK